MYLQVYNPFPKYHLHVYNICSLFLIQYRCIYLVRTFVVKSLKTALLNMTHDNKVLHLIILISLTVLTIYFHTITVIFTISINK